MSATEHARQMAITAAKAAADKQAQNIVVIDVSDRLAITDCFVIASGTNDRQVQAIVDSVEEQLRMAGFKPARREGERDGRWVLLDYIDIVVHVQHTEERVFYALERLWRDCPTFEYEDGPDGANLTADDLAVPAAAENAENADGLGSDSPASDGSASDGSASDGSASDGSASDGSASDIETGVEADEVPLGHS